MRYTEDFTTLLPKQFELELRIGTGELVDISRNNNSLFMLILKVFFAFIICRVTRLVQNKPSQWQSVFKSYAAVCFIVCPFKMPALFSV